MLEIYFFEFQGKFLKLRILTVTFLYIIYRSLINNILFHLPKIEGVIFHLNFKIAENELFRLKFIHKLRTNLINLYITPFYDYVYMI